MNKCGSRNNEKAKYVSEWWSSDPQTRAELRCLLGHYTVNVGFRVMGEEVDRILNMMLPGLGRVLPAWAMKPWAESFGWSLWSFGVRG